MKRYTARQAQAYKELRPGYPEEIYDWIGSFIGLASPRIVEIGCGPGNFSRLALTRWKNSSIYIAIDANMNMLRELELSTSGGSAVQAISTSLPISDSALDLVVCPSSLHQFPLLESIAEICRVLRPGGTLVALWNQVGHCTSARVPRARLRTAAQLDRTRGLSYGGEMHSPFIHTVPHSLFALHETCDSPLKHTTHVSYTCRAYAYRKDTE